MVLPVEAVQGFVKAELEDPAPNLGLFTVQPDRWLTADFTEWYDKQRSCTRRRGDNAIATRLTEVARNSLANHTKGCAVNKVGTSLDALRNQSWCNNDTEEVTGLPALTRVLLGELTPDQRRVKCISGSL